jgi:hypothetical protein
MMTAVRRAERRKSLCLALYALLLLPAAASAQSLTSAVLHPTTVVNGTSSVGTVTLGAPAPAGGVSVLLVSSDPAALTSPSVLVPQGSVSARFVVDTFAVAVSTQVTIDATYNGVTFSPTLTVTPRVPVRGSLGDLWADTVIGQPDFSQVTMNEVTSARLFSPGGILVDRSVQPNRIYLFDGGNSRVLGLSHLGTCGGGPNVGGNCTANSDCPGSICAIQEGLGADLVLGQPTFTSSGCNGDSGFQRFPTRAPATASTLCSTPESQVNMEERGGWASLALDGAGNLYVPDFDNHRVLRYNSPFTTDAVADYVWGQENFTENSCNRGLTGPVPEAGPPLADAQSLCLRSVLNKGFTAGVDIDPSGNLWVTDNANHRVLRFPKDPLTGVPQSVADLVLGQPNFTTSQPGTALNRMCAPAAVRVDGSGTVYVADSQLFCGLGSNGRVLVFSPPLTSGMSASSTLGSGLSHPSGLTLDPAGGIWVSDTDNSQFLLFVGGSVQKVLGKACPDYTGSCGNPTADGPLFCYDDGRCVDSSLVCQAKGSIGIDSDGNVFLAANTVHDMWRFPAPIPAASCASPAHSADKRIFLPKQYALGNHVGAHGFRQAPGLAVTADQLILGDSGRLLFWNGPSTLTGGQAADGYAGQGQFTSFDLEGQEPYGRIAVDRAVPTSHLWAVGQPGAQNQAQIEVYSLPLQGLGLDPPTHTLTSPLNVKGGGTVSWDSSLVIGGIAAASDGSKIWIADATHHRVFRVSDPLSAPIVDVVLGQLSANGTSCNRGSSLPSQNSLCRPGAVTLDPQGNVYVSDGSLEADGNLRLLEFDRSLFPDNPTKALFGVPASRVFGRHGSFTETQCLHSNFYNKNISCAQTQPAFTSDGQMVVGTLGDLSFPVVYKTPLLSDQVDGYLNDFTSYGGYSAVFDSNDDLYMVDLDRASVLIYRHPLCSPVPTATVSGGGAICDVGSSTVQAALTGTGPWTVKWSDGVTQSGVTSSPAIRTVTPAFSTMYTVTDVSDASCSGTSAGSAAVGVGTTPSASITAPSAVCPNTSGHTASVPDAGSGGTYAWTIGNGTITAGAGTKTITWRSGSASPVTLNVTVRVAAGCSATGSTSMTNVLPSAVITAPAAVCPNTPDHTASVPDAGSGATYTWTVTNGAVTAGAGTRTITWSSGSASPVALKVTVKSAAGCSVIGSKSVTNTAASAAIAAPTAVCGGSTANTASVPAAGTGATYTWSIGNGTITSGAGTRGIQFTAGTSGSVTLNVTVVNATGCSTSGLKTIPINPTPSSTITAPSSVCHNSTGNLASAPAGGSTYSWTVTGGTLTAGQGTSSITFKAGASGSVTLKVTVGSNKACKSTSSQSVSINTGC